MPINGGVFMSRIICSREDDLLTIRVSGFVFLYEAGSLKEQIIAELEKVKGTPFRVMFDLRGMKAVNPSVLKGLKELDDYLYESSAVKIGTVFDSLIAKIQHLRTAEESKGRNEINVSRSKIFSNPDECRAWLKEGAPGNAAGESHGHRRTMVFDERLHDTESEKITEL